MAFIRHQVIGACVAAWGEAWRLRAACRGMPDADAIFFSEVGRSNIARAKAVCKTCPVTVECLQFAMDYHIPFGVYGGMTEKERRRLAGLTR